METVDIPGGSAQIRTVAELTVRQRRLVQTSGMMLLPILAKIPQELREAADESEESARDAQERVEGVLAALPITRDDAETMLSSGDSSIVAFLAGWTLDDPLPTMETVGELPTPVYDALAKAVAERAASIITGSSVNLEPTPRGVDSPFVDSATSETLSVVPS